jgi:hypothetical protein
MQNTRFDLEAKIMECWQTQLDIELLFKMVCDGESELTADELENYLLGLSVIHNARSQDLFDTFEDLVHRKIID